ncbi:hypothetical protein [Tautonia plasticadhaerens]|uniref:Uncharacterized protein n=1 Tax=Tautonia plasticadhaerens TaxID=2527974 RepID=A0A518HEG7_9BACT|nr:hypothetical protein [Tautonia plasticadhaerens]QDV39240.1 hypothetical protein ElP_72040 [Tautonia plasticadhaerens]
MLAVQSHARLGTLVATSDAMAAIPRDALSRAVRCHAYARCIEGEPFRTRHSWEGVVFYLRTDGGRSETTIWLEEER